MQFLGIGTDIIEIERVRKAVERASFVKRVFSAAEAEYCLSRGRQSAASFAARFAGKEAVLKALGTGHIGGSLTQVEILNEENGRPIVRLSGFYADLAQERGIDKIEISLSHAREYAVAQAIVGRMRQ